MFEFKLITLNSINDSKKIAVINKDVIVIEIFILFTVFRFNAKIERISKITPPNKYKKKIDKPILSF